MAELATIARPYAEAAFAAARDAGASADEAASALDRLAQLAADPALREVVGSPRVTSKQIADLLLGTLPSAAPVAVQNLIAMLAENRRLSALGQVAEQFRALKDAAAGRVEAVITSAFPIEGQALTDLVAALERKYGRQLHAKVEIDPSLIGGVRVAVGDEVLDTSVRARLEQMKVALTA